MPKLENLPPTEPVDPDTPHTPKDAPDGKLAARLDFLERPECKPDFRLSQNRKVGFVRPGRGLGTVHHAPPKSLAMSGESSKSRSLFGSMEFAEHTVDKVLKCRQRTGRIVNSWMVQCMVVLFVFVDAIFTVVYLLDDGGQESALSEEFILIFDTAVIVVLGGEVFARLFYVGLVFFKNPLYVFELCLVPLAILELVMIESNAASTMRMTRPIFRALRVLRGLVRTAGRGQAFWGLVRKRVSSYRRRYTKDGFDLDLAYVHDQLIVTSVPGVGLEAMFRNPMEHLAQFLNENHTNNYLLINLTEERRYPLEPFFGRYLQLPIAQYSVPRLEQMWDFCELVQEFLEKRSEHTICIHSKNACGRVSVVAIAWLLYSCSCSSAVNAIALFESCRADSEGGARDEDDSYAQSVETSSQMRFLEYFAELIRIRDQYGARHAVDLLRTPRKAQLKRIQINGLTDKLMAQTLQVRCFRHPRLGTDESFAQEDDEFGHATSSRSIGDVRSMMQIVRDEIAAVRIDTINSGCEPRRSRPLFDTSSDCETDHTLKVSEVRSEPGAALQEVSFNFDDTNELQGEVAYELCCQVPIVAVKTFQSSVQHLTSAPIASSACGAFCRTARVFMKLAGRLFCGLCRRTQKASDFMSAELTKATHRKQTLHSFWLHTSFLELHKSLASDLFKNPKAGNVNVVTIALGRFDVDKIKGAQKLASYSVSYKVTLTYEAAYSEHDIASLNKRRELLKIKLGSREIDGPNNKQEDIMGLSQYPAADLGWLNWMVQALWPYTEAAGRQFLVQTVEPLLNSSLPTALQPVRFMRFNLGKQPPLIGPLIATRRESLGLELQMYVGLKWEGGVDMILDVSNTAEIGISGVSVNGVLCVRFSPVLGEVPVIGGVQVFLLNSPDIDITFAGHLQLANTSFVRNAITQAVQNALLKKILLPHMVMLETRPEAIKRGERRIQFGECAARAVLRLTVKAASRLRAADWYLLRKKSSDPYCLVQLGSQKFKTRALSKTLNPEWEETFDLILYDWHQDLSISVYDQDFGKTDDLLGEIKALPCLETLDASGASVWLHLEDPVGDRKNRVRGGSQICLSAQAMELRNDASAIHTLSSLLTEMGGDSLISIDGPEDVAEHAGSCMPPANCGSAKHGFMTGFTLGDVRGGQTPAALFIAYLPSVLIPSSMADKVTDASVQLSMGSTSVDAQLHDEHYDDFGDVPGEIQQIVGKLAKTRLTLSEIQDSVHLDEMIVRRMVQKARGFNGKLRHERLKLFVTLSDITSAESKLKVSVKVKNKVVAQTTVALSQFAESESLSVREMLKLDDKQPKLNDAALLHLDASMFVLEKYNEESLRELFDRTAGMGQRELGV